MTKTGGDNLDRLAEYYDFIASLGEAIDPLQAAMFVELEFQVTIPDERITADNLGSPDSAVQLIAHLKGIS